MGVNSIDTLKENVDIEGHLAFIEGLLNKYTWDNDRKKEIGNNIDLIRKKQNDTNFYLVVVGEFSSGKSSLINALIRDDILKSDILPATTAATTTLEYNSDLDVEVLYNSGQITTYKKSLSFFKKIWIRIFPFGSNKLKDEIKEYISRTTANEDISQTIQKVKIVHPSEVLKNGLVVIDTPGVNVDNPRHENVTKSAIRNLSDVAMVVIPSDTPISQSIVNFIRKNLIDVISRCIFIVTKVDLLRPKEKDRVLRFVSQKLQKEFNIKSVNVFPYSPLLVLKNTMPDGDYETNLSLEESKALFEESSETEKMVYQIIREQRMIVQLQKLVVLINSVLVELEGDLKAFEKNYEERHAALEANKIKNLAFFIKEQKEKHHKAIEGETISIRLEIINLVNVTQDKLLEEIQNEIYSTKNNDELKKLIKNRLDGIIKSTQDTLQKDLALLFDKFKDVGQKQKEIFEEEFKKLYVSLATLGGNISLDEKRLGQETATVVSKVFSEQVAVVKEVANSDDNKETWTIFGSGGAGAAIGTFILPGIGTAVGCLLGSLVSLLFKPALEEQQKKYYSEVSKTIDQSFAESLKSIEEFIQVVVDGIIVDLDGIIEKYSQQYNELIKAMILRDEKEKAQLLEKSRIIQEDLNQLGNREKLLASLKEKLLVI